ncbi:hypothetical protein D9613_003046 [Agrocybe pediades]|uniref:Uncharacterized protein n=1 Tax=Agrocybe pediades TaxID=84607 RepID=A0A8H4QP69_9AGAR|nr:hypothetical protein D9613_003046 [Agrocybe pediades]
MDDTAIPPSPTASTASDSDAYNTESARLYFGPLKTPERNFVGSTKNLFPRTITPLRRSPRLSSPIPPPKVLTDAQLSAGRLEAVDLVNETENVEEAEEESGSVPGTPVNGETLLDEPSSALAERIIHAHDNPSPPPSPPLELSLFDPYHTSLTQPSTDYQADLMSLEQSVPQSPTHESIAQQSDCNTPQEKLISFDSSMTPPVAESVPTRIDPSAPQPMLSIDDLLFKSPSSTQRLTPTKVDVPQVTLQLAENTISDDAMTVDEPSTKEAVVGSDPVEIEVARDLLGTPTDAGQVVREDEVPVTPLRRSTRPRRSITPTPRASTPVAPPSSARTQIRKKYVDSRPTEEVVSDSQEEDEGVPHSSSDGVIASTSSTARIRHRSPGKAPLSFSRELGSLSPTSTNVLASLAFGSTSDGSGPSTVEAPQSMFSFSALNPPEGTGPSTPVRSSGPIRFSSPSKAETSPTKFRIQTPAPNDPTNTPARRITISEAIAQGHVSPAKAAQLGYKPDVSTLAPVSTPAQRVLVSETPVPSTSKINESRLSSPMKISSLRRDRSAAEPAGRLATSIKGKEKELPSQGVTKTTTAVRKLPFPIVASATTTSAVSSSVAVQGQASSVNDPLPGKVSPGKSSLKQVASRIPRIGAKPYARVTAATAAKTKPTTMRMVDLTKSNSKPIATDNPPEPVKKDLRMVGASKATASSAARSKLSTSTTSSSSTTLLKRKRDAEKLSPAKPRTIMLRQVPTLPATTPSEPPMSAAAPAVAPAQQTALVKGRKPPQAPVRIRRVMDPEPPRPVAPTQATEKEETVTVCDPPKEETKMLEPAEENPAASIVEAPPGSPMQEDSPPVQSEALHPENEKPTEILSDAAPIPSITVVDCSVPETTDEQSTGLRRTTRSRKAAVIQDVFTETSTRRNTARRKAASSRSDDTFSGMSMSALKDLTMSNTMRNQRYLTANLETEIIRIEGVRPESPLVKVRTISQRQQDERDRQRAERAKRRARRSDEPATSSDVEGSDLGYSSPMDDQETDAEQETHIKHRRGAGEDEDYETPDRHDRHFKRTRLFVDDDMQVDEERPKRRVKWDRGLFTTVYIDEVRLGSRQTTKENMSLKGCLAPTAKARQLDTLGNLPHADSPLTDIVPEHITVKKIVYDSDVAAVPEVAVVKNTRSKAKKK